MIFIHNYFPKYTKKLIELGIAAKGDGFKVTQSYATPEEYRFNNIAGRGGELYLIVKDYASCFYIDRLQGGVFYSEYDYDRDLLDEYGRMCDFLGFQLHELGTTRMLDWCRVERQLKALGLARTEENVIEAVRQVSANKTVLHFSQGRPKEYAGGKKPETLTEAFADVLSVIERAKERTGNRIFNCDAGTSLAAMDGKAGLKLSFIEVGCQTLYSRMQYALRRGVSRASGGKWGAYLEPWSHMANGTTCYCFMRNGSNEWFVGGEGFAYNHDGERGGSSMSYARRMMYYSLFSGADYFSEEWGQSNTFYDFEGFELSPYGKIKQEFCTFARKFKNVKPYCPVAIIIPREYGVFNTHCRAFPYEECKDDTRDGRWRSLPRKIVRLMYNGERLGEEDVYDGTSLGSEDRYFTVGRYGSILDVIFEDSYEHPEEHYELVLDYTGRFAADGVKIIDANNEALVLASLDRLVSCSLPVSIESTRSVDYIFFENEGRKHLAVFNHSGVSKDLDSGEQVNPAATVSLTLSVREGSIIEIYPLGGRILSCEGGIMTAELDGGEMLLIEYKNDN